MNKDNAHEYLPLVQAIADGQTVQVQGGDGNWYNSKLINIPPRRYRIKPEPRTFDVWRNEKTKRVISVEAGDHDKGEQMFSEWERITVMEVLK